MAFKFCSAIGTQDVITCVKFGDDRLRGFWLAGCQSSPFPIDFAGRPYNCDHHHSSPSFDNVYVAQVHSATGTRKKVKQ